MSDRASLPPWLWPRAAYVHVPFCAHHCGYCDFAVAVGQDRQIELYLDALDAELATLGTPRPVRTLFLGGGTPTHLSARQLERLLAAAREWLPLVCEPEAQARGVSSLACASGSTVIVNPPVKPEFSVEATPDSLDADKLAVLAAGGVTRVSLGAQSFRPESLSVLERRHNPEDVSRAVELARRYVCQVSLDLIFGVPGQTLDDWQRDLDAALALGSDHLSCYGLTYEKGTPLWKQR